MTEKKRNHESNVASRARRMRQKADQKSKQPTETTPPTDAEAPRPNPYSRLLAKLDEANNHKAKNREESRRPMKTSDWIKSHAPMPEQLADEMFAFVYVACERNGCACEGTDNDQFPFTREFCRTHGLDEGEIVPWLESFNAGCDCSLLLTVFIWFAPHVFRSETAGDPDFDPEVHGDVLM